jgi:hypothetical protein
MPAFTFQPVIPTDDIVDLGSDLVSGKRGLTQLKKANGISGCLCEKYDGEELPAIAMAADGPQSLEEIGRALQEYGSAGDAQAAISIPILLGIILQIIRMLQDLGTGNRNNGEDGGPV